MEGVACPEEIDQVCNAFSFWSGLGYFKVEVDIVSEDGETLCGGCPADWSESDVEVAKNALLDPHCFVSTGYLITDKFREECGALTD